MSESIGHFLRPGTLQLPALPPLSLYVHLPWCLKKCPYCDFNSHQSSGEVPQAEYLAALRADLEAALPLVWGRRIHSIFIGGGTPSLFSPQGIDALLGHIRALLPLEPGLEITLEANPGTFRRVTPACSASAACTTQRRPAPQSWRQRMPSIPSTST